MLRKPVSTPLRFSCNEEAEKSKKTWTSRRRPTYAPSTSSLQKLHERKIEAIDAQQRVAESENKRASDHHELDLQIKKEKLKQEKLKSRIHLLDLKLKKKQLSNASCSCNISI